MWYEISGTKKNKYHLESKDQFADFKERPRYLFRKIATEVGGGGEKSGKLSRKGVK